MLSLTVLLSLTTQRPLLAVHWRLYPEDTLLTLMSPPLSLVRSFSLHRGTFQLSAMPFHCVLLCYYSLHAILRCPLYGAGTQEAFTLGEVRPRLWDRNIMKESMNPPCAAPAYHRACWPRHPQPLRADSGVPFQPTESCWRIVRSGGTRMNHPTSACLALMARALVACDSKRRLSPAREAPQKGCGTSRGLGTFLASRGEGLCTLACAQATQDADDGQQRA